MADDYVIAINGLAATRSLQDLPKSILLNAQRAVNRTADRTSTRSRELARQQINFAARYLTGTDSSGKQRLGVSKRATSGSLEAIITGRDNPTSLARFVVGAPTVGKAGVTVQVAPGFARYMQRAFLIRLPAGRADIQTQSNLGLAIRLKPGEVIHNKRVMARLSGNLYLLYGPSVDQVFASIREDVAPDAEQFLGDEFSRLMGMDL